MQARRRHQGRRIFADWGALLLLLSGGCVGAIGGTEQSSGDGVLDPQNGTEGAGGAGGPEGSTTLDAIPTSGLRRLTASEYSNTVIDLLGDHELPIFELLPTDPPTPFDNDYAAQVASQGLIDPVDFIAELAADRLIADTPRRDKVVGCVPSSAGDETCLRSFVSTFGRRAMRRTLSASEVDDYVLGLGDGDGALAFATEANDFYMGVHFVVWSMLQDPGFLYRTEIGTEIEDQPGVYRLTGFEVASRLSYLLWGSMPDDALLDRAEAGELETAEDRKAAAKVLLEDEKAIARITRFHAMWLGYEQLPFGGQLGADMRAETRALIARVIFDEKRPWQDLLLSDETYVTDFLADHYGLTAPDSPEGGWVKYADSPGGFGRAGLLSHGSFLSIGAKFDDTSPVRRGLMIRERLLCQDIADPPPDVNVDDPVLPENALCKPERLAAHRQGGCAACHTLMDPLGFGLESYDQFGVFRTHETDIADTEADESQCEIEGRGEFEQGDFVGPGELGELLTEGDIVSKCLTRQLYRFASGRSKFDDISYQVVNQISEHVDRESTFEDLVMHVVAHASFANRTEE